MLSNNPPTSLTQALFLLTLVTLIPLLFGAISLVLRWLGRVPTEPETAAPEEKTELLAHVPAQRGGAE